MHAVEDAFLPQLFEKRLIELVPGTDWLISPMNGLLNDLFFIAPAPNRGKNCLFLPDRQCQGRGRMPFSRASEIVIQS